MNVFVFPGQGSQNNQMLKNLNAYSCKDVVKIFEIVSDISRKDIVRLIEKSSNDELKKTKNTQVVMFAMDLAYGKVLESFGIFPHVVAGHSLGQYAALVMSGILDIESACRIVVKRADLMSKLHVQGELCAFKSPKINIKHIENVCQMIRKETGEIISIALYNSCKQIVVGGTKKSVSMFKGEMDRETGYSTSILSVSLPFHTLLMEDMTLEFQKYIQKVKMKQGSIPIILNTTGEYFENLNDEKIIKEELINQCYKPVQWIATMEKIIKIKNSNIYEVGPGRTLAGFFKNDNPFIKVLRADDRKSIEKIVNENSEHIVERRIFEGKLWESYLN